MHKSKTLREPSVFVGQLLGAERCKLSDQYDVEKKCQKIAHLFHILQFIQMGRACFSFFFCMIGKSDS